MSSSITDIITSVITSSSTSESASSTTSYRQPGFSGGPKLNQDRPGQVNMGPDPKPVEPGKYGNGIPLYGQIIIFVVIGLIVFGTVFGFWWFNRKWRIEADKKRRERQMLGSVEVRDGDKGEVEVIELPKLGRNDERV